jgi:hypothetical protein
MLSPLSQPQLRVVRSAVDWVINSATFASGNTMSKVDEEEEDDEVVHWCHGVCFAAGAHSPHVSASRHPEPPLSTPRLSKYLATKST